MELTSAQMDRACGALVATAAGDALGAGYEFGPPLPPSADVVMKGGGSFRWAPGEWTDDTSMAIPIAREAAAGRDLRAHDTQDDIVAAWVEWAQKAPDVGLQTSAVLRAVRGRGSAGASAASQELHERTGRSAGNGSLMRTAPVALALLDDADGLTEAATALSRLTHWDDDAADACVLWCHLIRHAVLQGEVSIEAGLAALAPRARDRWGELVTEATGADPRSFPKNGWVVQALQGAWAAISSTAEPPDDPGAGTFPAGHLRGALEEAVRGGRDTDTVAAIAGGLLGARWGVSAVPASWRRRLHGWPGLRADDLADLAVDIVGARPSAETLAYRWAAAAVCVPHPTDPGVLLGNIRGLRELRDVDAVVSLCRVGAMDAPAVGEGDWVKFWLVDRADPAENPNLLSVLDDAARTVAGLRAEGKRVFLHCVEAHSRTPTVAALHAVRQGGLVVDDAVALVAQTLPAAAPKSFLTEALRQLSAAP